MHLPEPIDVIIPVFHRADLAEITMRAVLETTSARVVLVDDRDGEPATAHLMALARGLGRVRVIEMPVNGGWTGATRAGVDATSGEFFLLLNSDCTPTGPGWLETMTADMASATVGVVGARLIYPRGHRNAGKIQHAGVARMPQGNPYHIFAGLPADFPGTLVRKEVNAVTGACFLVRRTCWNALRGWAPEFGKGVYDDADFCWRARKAGWAVVYEPAALLTHEENASKEADGTHALHSNWMAHLRILLDKHGMQPSDEPLFIDAVTFDRWQTARALMAQAVKLAPDLPFRYRTVVDRIYGL